MLVVVTALFGNLQNLHSRAYDEIMGVPHTAGGQQRDEVLSLVLLDQCAEIVRADRKACTDIGQRERFIGILRLDNRHGAVAEKL